MTPDMTPTPMPHPLEWYTSLLLRMGLNPDTGEPVSTEPDPNPADFLPCQEYGLEEIAI